MDMDLVLDMDLELDMDLVLDMDTEVSALHISATLGLALVLLLFLWPAFVLPLLPLLASSMSPREQRRLMLTMDPTPWATLDMELDLDLDMDTWALVTQPALATQAMV